MKALTLLAGLSTGLMAQSLPYGLTSPGTDRTANQLTNPALLLDVQQPEFALDWHLDEQQELQQLRWQLALPGLALARERYEAQGYQRYQLQSAFGSPVLALGLGVDWLAGDNRPAQWQAAGRVGALWRPNSDLSLGASVHWGGLQQEWYQLDAGWRPWSDPRLTLFADYRLGDLQAMSPWSLGLSTELGSRWLFSMQLQEQQQWQLGLSYQLAGVGLGYARLQGTDSAWDRWSLRFGGQPGVQQLSARQQSQPLWYQLDLDSELGHRPSQFWQRRQSLLAVQQELALVAEDPGIDGVLVNTTNLSISQSMAWELAQSLKAVAQADKEVVVYVERGGMAHLQLIAVATQVYLDPQGSLSLPGFASSGQYFAEALAELGIGVTTLSVGDYKSATESLALSAMSDADREQRQAIINSQFSQLAQDLSAGRQVRAAQLQSLFERQLFLTPDDLARTGLVDALVRWHALDEHWQEERDVQPRRLGRQQLLARHPRPAIWGPIPRVAVLYALDTVDLDSGMNTRELAAKLQSLRENDDVRAVVVRVDSPGGDILASDLLAEQVRLTAATKPVLVSMTNVAASGGYWIAMHADAIYSTPNTITGSIGVASSFLWDDGLSQRLGLRADQVSIGSSADLTTSALFGLLPYRALTNGEREQLQGMSEYYYDQFVTQAAAGRNLSVADMQALAQGRVYSGRDAVALSLIDGEASLYQVVQLAKAMANIDHLPRVELEQHFAGQDARAMNLLSLLGVKQPLWQASASQYLQQLLQHNGQVRAQLLPDYYPY